MQLRAPRTVAALALAGGLALIPVGPSAQADPVSNLVNGVTHSGAPFVIFVVKDLGGGAYWNITTQTLYVVETGSAILVDGAQTTADLLATLSGNGRDLLLLINGAVLVPVQQALGG